VDQLETWWKGTPVVDDGDADTIAGRVEELVRDPGLAVELGATGRDPRPKAAPDHARARGRAPVGGVGCSVRWPGEGPAARRHRPRAGRGARRGRTQRAPIGEGLARAALAIKVDGELRDLARPLHDGARIEIVTQTSAEALELIRHDAAHVLADARSRALSRDEDLDRPADRRRLLLRLRVPRGREGLGGRLRAHRAEDARARQGRRAVRARGRAGAGRARALPREDEDYKVELIEDLIGQGGETVSLYRNGPFTDLCRGPHAPDHEAVKAFKLESVAGAYWRGDSDRQMLTRIYGTAFLSKEELAEHMSGSRRRARATTASSAASSTSSCSASSRRARRSGSRRAWRSGTS
jgi:hypothetical protein